VTNLIHDFCVWQEHLTWSQAGAILLLLIGAVGLAACWGTVEDEFRSKDDQKTKGEL